MKLMSVQMNEMYPSIIKSMLDKEKNLTAVQKAELEKELIQKSQDFSVRFDESFFKAVNFQEYIDAIFYPLYDKFFTEGELKDLLAFYKTSTGQKLNDITPQVAAESVRLSQEFLMPKINTIVLQLIKEDAEKVKKIPPPKGKSEK